MASHSIGPSGKIENSESIVGNEFAKCEIKTSVFSGRKPQAGNCCSMFNNETTRGLRTPIIAEA